METAALSQIRHDEGCFLMHVVDGPWEIDASGGGGGAVVVNEVYHRSRVRWLAVC